MDIVRILFRHALLTCASLLAAIPAGAQVDVLTHRYDNARTGINLRETQLDRSKVKKGSFGKLAFRIVDGNIYAQPLIVSQARIAGRPGPVNIAIVATEHNSVYAFDADDTTREPGGRESTRALWHTGPQVLGAPIDYIDIFNDSGCSDLTTEVGITGTPVIQLTQQTAPKEGIVFVAAKSKTDNQFTYRLFALNLADGAPVGSVDINGDVQTAAGPIRFDPRLQLNRPALLLDQNVVYVAFGGHCDRGDYRGWVFAYDVSDPKALKPVDAFPATLATRTNNMDDKEGRAGIWMSGHGPAADTDGSVYFVTGDGTYDTANPTALNLGNSVVKIKLVGDKIQVQDWYSPQNRDHLKQFDADLGSGGPVLVPNSHLLLTGGKEGRMYLIDRNDMGRGTRLSLQSFQVTNPPLPRFANPQKAGDILFWNLHGSPVIWPRRDKMFVYVMGEEDTLKQYRLVSDNGPAGWKFESTTPFKKSKESAPLPNPPDGLPNDKTRNMIWMPGGFLTISANGANAATADDTAILWATMPFESNANHEIVRGVLRAFNAVDVSKGQLWSSESTGNDDDRLGLFAKNNPPVVANGKVYVATFQQERIDNGIHRKAEGGDQPALVLYGVK
jgi:hypothetical protein